MKAPVGLLSDRTVLRQQDGGASPRQVPSCRSLYTIVSAHKKSPVQAVHLHLTRELHAPAHAGVVHQAGQGKAVLRGVAVAAGTPQFDAAACFPDLILKAVDIHRAADDLRVLSGENAQKTQIVDVDIQQRTAAQTESNLRSFRAPEATKPY